MKKVIELPKSKFLKVVCKKCKHQQIVFSKPATVVKCENCGAVLIEPTGGKGRLVNAKVIRELG